MFRHEVDVKRFERKSRDSRKFWGDWGLNIAVGVMSAGILCAGFTFTAHPKLNLTAQILDIVDSSEEEFTYGVTERVMAEADELTEAYFLC